MAIDTRLNFNNLAPAARDRFLEAVLKLKAAMVPGRDFSVYDQFTALHASVMGVRAPGEASLVNMGHQNIGFLPWHREFLRRFEKALQAQVPGVTLPYWEWPDARNGTSLFTTAGMGPSRFAQSTTGPVTGLFAFSKPAGAPAWFPAALPGWRVHVNLRLPQFGLNEILLRGSSDDDWPAAANTIQTLENLNQTSPTANPYWAFWRFLESGARMHNTGHNVVGGHMSNPFFSPNDPIFWLHHCYIDRVWARWQANRRAAQAGSTFRSHYPPASQRNPFTLSTVPNGHRIDDMMWPWVGTTPGYSPEGASPAVRAMLPTFAAADVRRVAQTMDTQAMEGAGNGYQYS